MLPKPGTKNTPKKTSPENPSAKYTPSYLFARTRGQRKALEKVVQNPDIDGYLNKPVSPHPTTLGVNTMTNPKVQHTPPPKTTNKSSKAKPTEKNKEMDPEAIRRQKEAEAVNKQLNASQQHTARGTSKSLEDLLSARGTERSSTDSSAEALGALGGNIPSKDDLTSDLLKQIQALKRKVKELTLKSGTKDTARSRRSSRGESPPKRSSKSPSNRSGSSRQRRNSSRPEVEYPHDVDDGDSDSQQSDGDNVSNHSRSNNRRHNSNFRCEMGQWPIKFNGTGVQKFLKKLNRLQKSYGYDDATVAKYFHLLVEGRAADWYWMYCDEYEDVVLKHLKVELAKRFKSEETDMTLLTRMYERKQGRDSFCKFYDDVLDINFSMKSPLDDSQIIEILRTNMDDEVRQRIFTYETKDRTKFYHKANSAYLDVCKSREKRSHFNAYPKVQRRVNEIDFEELSAGEVEEISTKINNWKQKRALKCYNCHAEDHLLRKCPVPITRFFCFVCGLEGVIYPQCPKCLNRKGSAEEVRQSHS